MKKVVSFITSVCICISLVGYGKSSSTINNNVLDENKAISMVIKDHPDFPSNQTDTLTKKLPTGGPVGTTANVKFTTKVEKVAESTYVVTLTKDWGIAANGKYAKSFWKYNVTPNSVTLIESIDNDDLPNTMK